MKILILVLFSISLSAQIYPSRNKGEVLKSKADRPMENIDKSGLIVVTKSMYGLTFEDKKLSEETKQRIEKFFRQQNKGYTNNQTYQLKIRRFKNDWYIENYKF